MFECQRLLCIQVVLVYRPGEEVMLVMGASFLLFSESMRPVAREPTVSFLLPAKESSPRPEYILSISADWPEAGLVTKLYSVYFSLSKIAIKKCVFSKRTINVSVSCF